MNFSKTLTLAVLALGLSSPIAYSNTGTTKKVLEKDNTGRNMNQSVTAETQMNGSATDVEITRKLRDALTSDDQLSMNAHNIKIVTVRGVMTLEGPVANKQEKMKIENLARSMSDVKKLESKLTY